MKAIKLITNYLAFLVIWSFAFTSAAIAADLYRVTITTEGTTRTFSDTDPFDLWKRLKRLDASQFPGYVQGVSAAWADLDFRGVEGRVSFPTRNGTEAVLSVPSAGLHKTFRGATRSDSVDQLVRYLRDNKDDLLGKLMAQAVARSPLDPVAGNPASMMGRMVNDAFSAGFGASSYGASRSRENIFRAGIQLGRFNQGGSDIDTITVPLSYAISLGDGDQAGPHPTLTFELPLTYMRISHDVDAYQGAFGIAYSHPVTANWRLTPSVRYGVAGSVEMKSLGHVVSGNLTSMYRLPFSPLGVQVNIGNMFGYYRTLPVKLLGYSIDTNLKNYVTKNGILLSKQVEVADYPLVVESYFTDTRFFGDNLYIDQYNEVGVAIKPAHPKGWTQYVGINLTYLFSSSGDDVNGGTISLSYDF